MKFPMAFFDSLVLPVIDMGREARSSVYGRFSLVKNIDKREPARAAVRLLSPSKLGEVNQEYLSFSIDISVLAGGYWWEGSRGVRKGLGTLRVPPLDLNSDKLDMLVRALGPSYLRIGGSEADKIHYFESPEEDKDGLAGSRFLSKRKAHVAVSMV